MLAEVSTLDLQNRNKSYSRTAKKWARKAWLAEAPVGEAACGQPQQGPPKSGASASEQPDSDPVLGSGQKGVKDYQGTGLVCLDPCLQKVMGLCKVLASARDPLVALLMVDKRRDPDLLGNLDMAQMLRRV